MVFIDIWGSCQSTVNIGISKRSWISPTMPWKCKHLEGIFTDIYTQYTMKHLQKKVKPVQQSATNYTCKRVGSCRSCHIIQSNHASQDNALSEIQCTPASSLWFGSHIAPPFWAGSIFRQIDWTMWKALTTVYNSKGAHNHIMNWIYRWSQKYKSYMVRLGFGMGNTIASNGQ